MGARRPAFRKLRHLASAGRKPVHDLRVRRDPRPRVWRGGDRLLRNRLRDPDLPDRVRHAATAVDVGAGSRVRDRGRLRARPLREQDAGDGRRRDRHRRDAAVHRVAGVRDGGLHRRVGHPGRLARDRLRHPRRHHLRRGAAIGRTDRGRKGHPDLGHRPRRRHLHPDSRRGYAHIPGQVPSSKLDLPRSLYVSYSTLAFGSALALYLYPHALTGTFSSSSSAVIRRNSGFLPIYSVMLLLLAMLGYMAIAAGTHPTKGYGVNGAVPALFQQMFPPAFAGFALAAIAIGALVPASVMAIASANLFSRNIMREVRPAATAEAEARASKLASLFVKFGAVVFILAGLVDLGRQFPARGRSLDSSRRYRPFSWGCSFGDSTGAWSWPAGRSGPPGERRCSSRRTSGTRRTRSRGPRSTSGLLRLQPTSRSCCSGPRS